MRERRGLAVTLACVLVLGGGAGNGARADAAADSLSRVRSLLRDHRNPEAEATARRLVATLDAAGAPDTARAPALDALVDVLIEAGRWSEPEARATAERAVHTNESGFGAASPQAGRSLISLARLLYRAGDWESARPFAQRGLDLCERAYGPKHASVLRGLHYLANIEEEAAEFDDAERLYRREIAVAESLYGARSAPLGNALNSMAVMERKAGRYSEARGLYERALAMREQLLGPESPDLIFNLNNLGNLLGLMGEHARARQLLERSLRVTEKGYGADHPYAAQVLGNLGSVEAEAGDTALALEHLARSLVIREKALGPDHPDLAFNLNDLAEIWISHGDFSRAREALVRAHRLREKAYGPDHPELAKTLALEGELELASGDAATAVERFAHALAIRERVIGSVGPDVAECLEGLARAERATGSDSSAFEHALRAEAVATEHVRLTARVLEERIALGYAATRRSALGLAITLAVESDGDSSKIARAWDALIRERALVLDEMARRHRAIHASVDSTALLLADSLRASSERLAWLLSRGANDVHARERLDHAQRDRERIEFALAGRSALFRHDASARAVGYTEVRRALGEGDALLAFVQYTRGSRAASMHGTGVPVESYAAFMMRRSGRIVVRALGPAAEIDSAVARWMRAAARRPSAVARTRDETACRLAGEEVRRRVWDPVAPQLRDARRILIVPDGALQVVDLGALPAGPGRYLVEGEACLHGLSAERDVVRDDTIGPAGRGLLALGGPDFGPLAASNSECEDLRHLRFLPLPAARAEAIEVAKRWHAASGDTDTKVLLGAHASKDAFRALAQGRRLLHLATHGFFLPASCPRRGGEAGTDSLAYEDPLLRSGIALAGSNRAASAASGASDGLVTGEEIATLDLTGVDWAVLSACDTGLGAVRAGEGVLGLRRAFAIAGTRTVIMSLWTVDDEATRGWMRALYDARLAHHLGAADALRRADLEVLRARRARGESDHPFYWAAFVAAGDWR